MGEAETAKRAVAEAMSKWGRVDVLVNNAGIGGDVGNIWELPVEEMDRVYRTNLRGVYLFTHYAVPPMLTRDYGRIVNIASIAGKEGNPRMVPYSATKAAVIGLTKSVGKELARTGVRVNCVTPAVVRTRILEQLTDEQVGYMVERIPMGQDRRRQRGRRARGLAVVGGVLVHHGRRLRHQWRPRDVLRGGLAA